MKILKSLKWRYATKQFNANKIIKPKILKKIEKAFNLTATSYGLQPVSLLILQNKTKQQELVEHSMNQKQVGQASHVLVFCIHTKIDKAYIDAYFKNVQDKRQTPTEILKPFHDFLIDDFSKKSQEQIEAWATKQAYLTMGNLLTVCAQLGVDACPMEGFSPDFYDSYFKLYENNLKSVLVMPIGYRDNNDMFSTLKKVRKPLSQSIIKW